MHLDGDDLRAAPLDQRKEALARLLKRGPTGGPLRLQRALIEATASMLKHACRMGLEGIISKLRDAPYRSGRGNDWLKTKCSDRQEFVVARLYALDRRRAGDRRAGARLLRQGRTDLCRARRHRLYPCAGARALPQAQAARRAKLAVQEAAAGRARQEPRRSGSSQNWSRRSISTAGPTATRVRQASFRACARTRRPSEVVREEKKRCRPAPAASRKSAP